MESKEGDDTVHSEYYMYYPDRELVAVLKKVDRADVTFTKWKKEVVLGATVNECMERGLPDFHGGVVDLMKHELDTACNEYDNIAEASVRIAPLIKQLFHHCGGFSFGNMTDANFVVGWWAAKKSTAFLPSSTSTKAPVTDPAASWTGGGRHPSIPNGNRRIHTAPPSAYDITGSPGVALTAPPDGMTYLPPRYVSKSDDLVSMNNTESPLPAGPYCGDVARHPSYCSCANDWRYH